MKPVPGHEASPEGDDSRALELLVLTVTVLDPDRAASLLGGLAESLRPAALRRCARLERMGRSGRHAALARVCAHRLASGAGRVEHIPGLLGAEVRKRLAPGDAGPQGSGPLERWARRLAAEL